MATITGFTAARMLLMEAETIVDGSIVGDDLILEKHDGSTVNAGNVRGPTGATGATGPSEAAITLTTDGDILTRAAGVPARMTRASLASDTAFTSRYFGGVKAAGNPAGTGTDGDEYYDTTKKRLWRSDGTGWTLVGWGSAAARPKVELGRSTDQLLSGVGANITWTVETSDADGFITAPGTTLTVPTGLNGLYSFSWRIALDSFIGSGGGFIQVVAAGISYQYFYDTSSRSDLYCGSLILPLAAGDTIYVYASESGSDSIVNASSFLKLYMLS